MRWASVRLAADGQEHAAVVKGEALYVLPGDDRLIDLLRRGTGALEAAAKEAESSPSEIVATESAELLAPIPDPPSVRDFMAFENHYVNTRRGLNLKVEPVFYEQPCFYFSNPAAIVGPEAAIPMGPGTSEFDYELEIGVIIGRPGRDLLPQDAEDVIAGYCILCDWSSRDLQAKETVFGTGPAKGKDTATSLGPFLVTPDELEPYRTERGFDLAMTATVNNKGYSSGNWSSIYWTVAECLAFASRGTELRPGDVVGTGTVGTGSIMELSAVHGSAAYPWLSPGDEVRLRVDQLGEVHGTVVASDPPAELR
jgi:2-keto-4-pentenoate hydratase/2-oxohepta-3-ene-1,7-dioic acid hydratase in catechol pathway